MIPRVILSAFYTATTANISVFSVERRDFLPLLENVRQPSLSNGWENWKEHLARGPRDEKQELTDYVVTRWYRAPEVIFCYKRAHKPDYALRFWRRFRTELEQALHLIFERSLDTGFLPFFATPAIVFRGPENRRAKEMAKYFLMYPSDSLLRHF